MNEEQIIETINQRRRQVLVHSFLYYQLNETAVTDTQYDFFCKDLIKLQQRYPEIADKCVYADDFRGFSLGDSFALPYSNPEIQDAGIRVLKFHKRGYK